MTRTAELQARWDAALMGNYGTPPLVLARGEGARVWDVDGREYVDLVGGIAVNAVGHAHPFVTSVISSQLATLGHISNFFTSPTQVALAEKLLALADAAGYRQVFRIHASLPAVTELFPGDPLAPFLGGLPAVVRDDGALAHLDRKGHGAHGECVRRVGAGAASGRDEPVGEVGQRGLVKE